MKRTIRLSALLAGIGFLLGACTEEDIIKTWGPKDCVGNEIVFGVSTASDTRTRTVYGDASADKGAVEVNWIPNDMLMIACPQAASLKLAHYQVTAETEINATVGSIDEYSETTIVRADGETASLQWGTGDGENGTHDFYAVYPSFKKEGMSATENEDNPYVTMDDEGFSGYLPLDQSVPAENVTVDETTGNIIVEPNMDIAYMVAKTEGVTRGADVTLEFSSLNTVLQFQVHRGNIAENVTSVGDILIHGASLISASGKAICGSFNYKFKDETCTSTEETASDYSRITLSLPEAKTLTASNYCDFTFFVLPTYANADTDDNANTTDLNDLRLQVMYSVGGNPQIKTATIKATITAHRKHLFKNVKLPSINAEVTGSNWFSGLANDIYVSQLSIPVAGNAFSSKSATAYKEQVKTYKELWDLGVRGFEICTYNVDNNTGSSIGGAPIISGGISMGETVSGAFKTLYPLLGEETLVFIFTPRYSSEEFSGVNFNPNVFVAQIENYLEAFMNEHSITNKADLFVKLNSGSHVGDLKGKIAVVVRPGDNDQITAIEGANKATVSTEWNGYITVIDDWGTSEDQWGDRYGNFFDQAGFYSASVTTKSVFETQYLKYREDYQTGSIFRWTWNTGSERGAFPTPVAAKDKNYQRLVNNDPNDIAYVQCWERVIQEETDYKQVALNSNTAAADQRLMIKWFESYTEKKEMAKYIANEAAGKKGQAHSPLYINSLCGFFVTDATDFSYMPQLASGNGTKFTDYSFKVDKSGTGGDFMSCAANLNYWFYNELKNESIDKGPYGLVMLDYIGATANDFTASLVTKETGLTAALAAEACQNLPLLIMMNNFTFPLATDPEYKEEPTTTPDATAQISFTDALVDPNQPVQVRWVE